MSMLDIDRMIENASTASQNETLLEPVTAEAIKLNVVAPLLRRLHIRDLSATDVLVLTEEQMTTPEFMAMIAARDIALRTRQSHDDVTSTAAAYDAAWEALAAKVR